MVAQLLIGGIAMGFVYALVAIEYTLIWNSCMLLNFAHGQLIMLGAYIFGGTFIAWLGFSYIMGWIGTIAVVIISGIILAFLVFIPLKDVARLYAIIATLMFGTMITEMATLIWGIYPYFFTDYLSGVYRFGNLVVTKAYVYIIVIAFIVVTALLIFMRYTKIGKAMRCVSENKAMSAMVGINVKQNMIITISLSCVICAIVGMLVAPLFSITISMADTIASKGFISGVLGGFGNVVGAIVGGVIVGVIENMATIVIPSTYKDITSYVILLIVILIKPTGLLGMNKTKIMGRRETPKNQ